jgi:glycosyltransferase involved in cell wall biosynthesis
MTNIAIDLRMYEMSGIGRYLQSVIPEVLPRLRSEQIIVFGNADTLKRESWASDLRIKIRHDRAKIFSIREQLNAFRWDHLRCGLLWVPHYNVPMAYYRKLVVTIHDLCQLAYPETLGSPLQRWYAKTLISKAVRQADAVLCVSEFTRAEIIKYLGCYNSKITVTYPGRGLATQERHVGTIPPATRRYILAVGNVKPHKNLRRLISAFELVRGQIEHELVIVGKRTGFLNPDNLSVGSSMGNTDRIRFTGHVSDAELLRYYRGADALVFPSLYEGFGFPIVEAMAQGCPVACSNAASLPEIAGDAALLFDPHDINQIAAALCTITSDGPLRQQMVKRGFERAAKFSAERCGQQTADVINAVLETC